jgi:tRNA (cmo5U34)-methyltransferase
MNGKTGWQTVEAARRYLKVSNSMIPGRADVYNIVAELAALFSPGEGTILDLGCGSGDVIEAVLQKAPGTSAVLIDFSDEMVRCAEERFRGNPEIRVIKYDLNRGIPDSLNGCAFDAVVSCFAFHHIEFERRVPVYAQIHSLLKPGGIFINGDRFMEESPIINQWMFDAWVRWMTDRSEERFGVSVTFDHMKAGQLKIDRDFGDKPGSIWASEKDLRAAGFTHIDCLYKNQIIAVIAAVK